MNALNDKMDLVRQSVNTRIKELLTLPKGPEKQVVEAMRYSSVGTGKALRPFLALESAQLFGVPLEKILDVACVIEMIHSYSLIHDDLPAMDNDVLRRGKPTCHIQFDEATAILAGDALLTKAFEILAEEKTLPDEKMRLLLIKNLALAIGYQGMIGGQVLDMMAEETHFDLPLIERLQSLKTGALINYSLQTGALFGKATETEINSLLTYGTYLGLIFQITDDLLDIQGDVAVLGKSVGKDSEQHKATFLTHLGINRAIDKANDLAEKAKSSLDSFGDKAKLLKDLIDFVLKREK